MVPAGWLWLSLPGLLAGGALLGWSILATLRAWRAGRIAELPLVADQLVEMPAAGPVVLHAVGPRFTTTFFGLDYELSHVDDGEPLPKRRAWFAFRTDGVTRARVPLRRFVVARPGPHRLRVDFLGADKTTEGRALLLTRGDAARTALRVAGIVLGGWLTLGALILTVLILVPSEA